MKYRWRALWRNDMTVTWSNDPSRPAGSMWTERNEVLVRREYRQPNDAKQGLVHLRRRFPPQTTWILEPMVAVDESAKPAC